VWWGGVGGGGGGGGGVQVGVGPLGVSPKLIGGSALPPPPPKCFTFEPYASAWFWGILRRFWVLVAVVSQSDS